jgi:hypothetical protein
MVPITRSISGEPPAFLMRIALLVPGAAKGRDDVVAVLDVAKGTRLGVTPEPGPWLLSPVTWYTGLGIARV